MKIFAWYYHKELRFNLFVYSYLHILQYTFFFCEVSHVINILWFKCLYKLNTWWNVMRGDCLYMCQVIKYQKIFYFWCVVLSNLNNLFIGKSPWFFFLFEDFIHYIKYNNPNLLELNNLLSKNHFLPPNSPRNIADIIIFFLKNIRLSVYIVLCREVHEIQGIE